MFHLHQQKLIEMIRNGCIEEALEYAQEQLAPKGESNPEFLIELEKTMSLFVLDPITVNGDLYDPYHRVKVANEINSAILVSQGHEQGSKLPSLLKMLLWSQEQLSSKAVFPKINNLVDCTFEIETQGNEMTDS